jgi:hypothetical protein
MFNNVEKESKEQLETTQKARELARQVLELKERKADADEKIKEAVAELQVMATQNPEWFTDAGGNKLKSCELGSAKLVWQTPSPQYSFNHTNLDLIGQFVKKYPKSIDYKLKAMQNIDTEEFGITVKVFEPKLVVEVSE